MRRRLKLLPALWLLALLIAPVVAWLAGVRQPLLTNEPKREFPAVNRSSVQDEQTFRRIDAAILDRLPFRQEALNLHASIAIDGFRDSSNPDVAIGPGGWLYFRSELRPCMMPVTEQQQRDGIVHALDVISGALAAGGYRAAIAVPAGKQFVHDRDLASFDERQEACMRRLSAAIDGALAEMPGGLPLDEDLRRLEADGRTTFYRTDTHWNWRGREQVTRKFLERVRPGLADEIGLSVGDWFERPTDLNNLLGLFERTERDRVVGARRRPARPLRRGGLVMLGDSQMRAVVNGGGGDLLSLPEALPGQALSCTWGLEPPCDRQFARADAVVVEMVLRDAHSLPTECGPVVREAGERAQGAPGRYRAIGGDGRVSAAGLTFGPSGVERVGIDAAGPDRDDVARLVALPVERFGPVPEGTPPAVAATPVGAGACATLTVDRAGRSLFVSVAAGQPLSGLELDLAAPAGTRLGPPQSIRLDGTDRSRARATTPARRDR